MPDRGADRPSGDADETRVDQVNHFAETMHRGLDPLEPSPQQYAYSQQPPSPRPSVYGHEPYRSPYEQSHASAPFEQPLTPQPPARSNRSSTITGVLIGLTAALVVALIVAAVVVWTNVANRDASDGDTAGPVPTPVAPHTVTETAQPTATQPTVTQSEDPQEAGRALAAQAAGDTARLRADFDGRWVAQLSAKQDGLEADGRVWDERAIHDDFVSMSARYPNVMLTRSSDWPVFSRPGWWVVLSAQQFSGPDEALDWCRGEGLDRDHCFAKLISSSRGPGESTVYQR